VLEVVSPAGPTLLHLHIFSGNLSPLCLKADQPLAVFILKPERAVCFPLMFRPIHHAHLEHLSHLRAVDPGETLKLCLPFAEPRSPSVGVQPTLGVEHPRPWGLVCSFPCYSCGRHISSFLQGHPLERVCCPLEIWASRNLGHAVYHAQIWDFFFPPTAVSSEAVGAESLVRHSLRLAGSRAGGLLLLERELLHNTDAQAPGGLLHNTDAQAPLQTS